MTSCILSDVVAHLSTADAADPRACYGTLMSNQHNVLQSGKMLHAARGLTQREPADDGERTAQRPEHRQQRPGAVQVLGATQAGRDAERDTGKGDRVLVGRREDERLRVQPQHQRPQQQLRNEAPLISSRDVCSLRRPWLTTGLRSGLSQRAKVAATIGQLALHTVASR